MKRVICLVLAAVIISSGYAGCGKKSVKLESPFSFDYMTTKENAGFFLENDTIGSLILSGPFYSGSKPLPFKNADVFEKARKEKVEDIKKEADTLFKLAVGLKPDVEKIRNSYIQYLDVVLKNEPKLKAYGKEALAQIVALKSKEELAEMAYNSMTIGGTDNPGAKALYDYLKVVKAEEITALFLQDINNITVLASMASIMLEESTSAQIKDANKKLDDDMKELDKVQKKVKELIISMNRINYGFKQLETGDYHMAVESTMFIEKSIPDLKSKAAALKTSEYISADDVKFIRSYVDYYDKFNKELKRNLNSIDKSKLIQVERKKSILSNVAYASDNGGYSNAVNSMNQPVKDIKVNDEGILSKGWSELKTAVKRSQKTVGVMLDTAGVAAKNIARVPVGLYYGNTASEIWDDMKKNSQEIIGNFKKGASGSQILKEAESYLDAAEGGIGDTAGSSVEYVIGKGNISWAVGGTAKLTAGMFTGLGKGIYKLANQNSNTTDYVVGGLDVVLSMVGGSKVVIKASKVPALIKGLATEGAIVAKGGINLIKSSKLIVQNKLMTQKILETIGKDMTQKEILSVIANTAEVNLKEAMKKVIENENKVLVQKMSELLLKGGKEALEESSKTIKDSISDMVMKGFNSDMKGVLEALKTAIGSSKADYVDNIAGSLTDNYIKEIIAQEVDKYVGEVSNEVMAGKNVWVLKEVTVQKGSSTTSIFKNSVFFKEGMTLSQADSSVIPSRAEGVDNAWGLDVRYKWSIPAVIKPGEQFSVSLNMECTPNGTKKTSTRTGFQATASIYKNNYQVKPGTLTIQQKEVKLAGVSNGYEYPLNSTISDTWNKGEKNLAEGPRISVSIQDNDKYVTWYRYYYGFVADTEKKQ